MSTRVRGRHIHHGYWVKGDETKEDAQVRLIEEMISRGGLRPGAKVLDVGAHRLRLWHLSVIVVVLMVMAPSAGCGVGGTSIHLAKNLKVSKRVLAHTCSAVACCCC
jgi:cyclopropane fatty-acyl-phospholipid synthase-like methyltransferase